MIVRNIALLGYMMGVSCVWALSSGEEGNNDGDHGALSSEYPPSSSGDQSETETPPNCIHDLPLEEYEEDEEDEEYEKSVSSPIHAGWLSQNDNTDTDDENVVEPKFCCGFFSSTCNSSQKSKSPSYRYFLYGPQPFEDDPEE